MLVLGRFEILEDFLGKFREILALDQVVGLQENLSQPRFANGVVFQIELVEAMKRIFMCL